MSANLKTSGYGIRLGSLGITVSRLKGSFGFEEILQPVNAANVNTLNVKRITYGLASLVGKYNDDPSWDGFPAFLEQYRREIDEMNRE